jgi:hypothetical protein
MALHALATAATAAYTNVRDDSALLRCLRRLHTTCSDRLPRACAGAVRIGSRWRAASLGLYGFDEFAPRTAWFT